MIRIKCHWCNCPRRQRNVSVIVMVSLILVRSFQSCGEGLIVHRVEIKRLSPAAVYW